jgi:uncharacterized protein (TIGR03437 family)
MRDITHNLRTISVSALVFFLTLGAAAQEPPEIFPNGVVNAASFTPPDFPGGGVAPGAIISIFGENLGPADAVTSTSLPLQTRLGPLETRVRINDSFDCPLFFVSSGQINCQLPENLAGDQIRLRVHTRLGESEQLTVRLRERSFGLFTMNSNGNGPLVAQNFRQGADPQNRFQLNRPDTPGQRNQIMILWGTGLGPTNPPVQAGEAAPPEAPAVNRPEVWVGNARAQVHYAGRAPGFAGLDQIQFTIPEDAPEGCAVPIRLQLQDQTSNIGTVAIWREQARCRDAFEDIISGLSHGSIVLNSGLGRLGPGQLGPGMGFGGPFGHGHGPGGMGPAGMGGGVRSGPGGVGTTGIGPFGIHPGIPPHAGGFGLGFHASLGPSVVTARFVRLTSTAQMDIGIPPAPSNSCEAHFLGPHGNPDLFTGPVQFLNAGSLTITGPGVGLTLLPERVGAGVLYASPLPPLEQGRYFASGDGGTEVGPFGPVQLTVPPLVAVTSTLAPGTTISRQQPLTLTWNGGNQNDLVVIHGRSYSVPPGTPQPVTDPMQYRSLAFVCSTTAGAGQFTVPDYVLGRLPDGMFSINVTHMPSAEGVARFEAAGLDLGGVFRWLDTVTYLDLILGP